jgi:hypothetical protein
MITYLGAPYSHPSPVLRAARVAAATSCARHLTSSGIFVYSPLTYAAALGGEGTLTNEKWLNHCLIFLASAKHFAFLQFPGFDVSYGLALELALAKILNLTIISFEPDEIKKIIGPEMWKSLFIAEV